MPSVASLPDDQVLGMHDALNQAGVEPDVAVSWALRALDKDQFWALPVAGDPFAEHVGCRTRRTARGECGVTRHRLARRGRAFDAAFDDACR